ncbi:MAG: hypothetical protein ABIJ08_01635, partial [Nanoarchaeota archaeon]
RSKRRGNRMTELKTFKDFNPEHYEGIESPTTATSIENYGNDIRQEAIRWIKELSHPIIENDEGRQSKHPDCRFWYDCEDDYYSHCRCFVVKNFIQKFFNITDEELK